MDIKINGFSTIFVIVLSILGFLVGFKACAEHKAKESALDQLDGLKTQLAGKDETIKRWVDKDSNNHLTIKQLELDKEIIHRMYELEKVKPKQIKSVTKYTTSIDTFFVVDSFYRDNDIVIRTPGDTVYLSLKDSLQITEYWKRKWFLGAKNTYIDIQNRNKYVKMSKIVAYRVKTKKPLFIIGPYMGYNALNNNFSAGVAIIIYPLSLKIY